MPSLKLQTFSLPLMLGVVLLSGCASSPVSPTLTLTESDVRAVPDVALPNRVAFADPKATGVEERAYLLEKVVKPLLDFSLAQEAVKEQERRRADALVEKAKAFNEASKPKSFRFLSWAKRF